MNEPKDPEAAETGQTASIKAGCPFDNAAPCSLVLDALAWAESNEEFVDRKLESRLRDAGRWASAGENACEILARYIREIQANT
jgi:hypothetical protein